MSKQLSMTATLRERAGKGNARATRRQGKVPAVIYGDNKPPVLIALEILPVTKALHGGTLFTQLCNLEVDGKKHMVLARDVQLHPVKDTPDHVDFLRVSEKTIITVDVPVVVVNDEVSPGIKARGVLTLSMHTLQVSCRADQIPSTIEADIGAMRVGDVLKVENLKLPANVEATVAGDLPVLTIAMSRHTIIDDEASEESAEVEVTKQKADKAE